MKKINFRLLKNSLRERSHSTFKRTYIKIPQGWVQAYDCIIDKFKKFAVPEIKEDIVDRYKMAYYKIIERNKSAFHKQKYNFSNFIDISK